MSDTSKYEFELYERVAKNAIAFNGGTVMYDKKFLQSYDNFDIIVTDNGDHIILETQLKEEGTADETNDDGHRDGTFKEERK